MKLSTLEKFNKNTKKNLLKILRMFIKSLENVDDKDIKISTASYLIGCGGDYFLPFHIKVKDDKLDLYIKEVDLK